MASRRHNFQSISWFYDLWTRQLLDLDPPYQRRSVWNQQFKDYFVDTVLLNYPAPALFLYENIGSDGRSTYHVVDGKQRLTSIFEFIRGEFPVGEKSAFNQLKGQYFPSLDDSIKKGLWGYQFLVEYIPTDDEKVINTIFDRINRNVAKLTPQELRHAKLDGRFITTCENLSEWMAEELPPKFPRFTHQAKQQMKDVELVALLLLLIEEGPRGYSQDSLDEAFTSRDEAWDDQQDIERAFRRAVGNIVEILNASRDQKALLNSRMGNQADFYSLFGAVHLLSASGELRTPEDASARLLDFAASIADESIRNQHENLLKYYDAARSASNDRGPREVRIQIMSELLKK